MQFRRRRPRVKHWQVARLEMVVAHRSIKFWSLFRVVFPVTSQCVILLVVVNHNCIFGFEIKFQVYLSLKKKQIKAKVPMNIVVMIFPTSFDHDKRSLQYFFSIFTLFWEKRTETKIMSHMRERVCDEMLPIFREINSTLRPWLHVRGDSSSTIIFSSKVKRENFLEKGEMSF